MKWSKAERNGVRLSNKRRCINHWFSLHTLWLADVASQLRDISFIFVLSTHLYSFLDRVSYWRSSYRSLGKRRETDMKPPIDSGTAVFYL